MFLFKKGVNMDFGELLSNSWEDYKKNFSIILKSFWWFIILPSIIFGVIALLIIIPFMGSIKSFPNLTNPAFSDIMSYFGSYFAIFAAFFVVYIVVSCILGVMLSASLYFSGLYNENGKMNFKQIANGGIGYFWKIIGLSLYIIFIMILILLPGTLSILLTVLFFSLKIAALGVIFSLISFLAVIGGFILLIYLLISWIFTVPIIIKENIGIRESMRRSRAIVKGNWWKTFGYFLLLVLILYIVMLVFSIPGRIIAQILSLGYDSSNTSTAVIYGIITYLIDFVFSIAASVITTPYSVFFLKNFYVGLRKGSGKK
jgi:glycerophosphoryl diester phosphodiesterase